MKLGTTLILIYPIAVGSFVVQSRCMPESNEFSLLLKNHRAELQLSVRQAATKVGISHSTLVRVEMGKLPDISSFAKLCQWLRLSPKKGLESLGLTQSRPR